MPNTFSKIRIRQAIDSAQNESNSINTRCQSFRRWANASADLYGAMSMQCRGQGRNFAEQMLVYNTGTTEEERKQLVNLLRRFYSSNESENGVEKVIRQPQSSTQPNPIPPPGAVYKAPDDEDDTLFYWLDKDRNVIGTFRKEVENGG